jgi:hypothetical protein
MCSTECRGSMNVRNHRNRLSNQGRVRHQRLHPWRDVGTAHVAALTRFIPARAGDRHQPRHRYGHNGAGTARHVQLRTRPSMTGGNLTEIGGLPAAWTTTAPWSFSHGRKLTPGRWRRGIYRLEHRGRSDPAARARQMPNLLPRPAVVAIRPAPRLACSS